MTAGNPANPTDEVLDAVIQEVEQTPPEYLPNLVQIIRLLRESVTLRDAEDSFRQGWRQAMIGQTLPISELWKDIDAE